MSLAHSSSAAACSSTSISRRSRSRSCGRLLSSRLNRVESVAPFTLCFSCSAPISAASSTAIAPPPDAIPFPPRLHERKSRVVQACQDKELSPRPARRGSGARSAALIARVGNATFVAGIGLTSRRVLPSISRYAGEAERLATSPSGGPMLSLLPLRQEPRKGREDGQVDTRIRGLWFMRPRAGSRFMLRLVLRPWPASFAGLAASLPLPCLWRRTPV